MLLKKAMGLLLKSLGAWTWGRLMCMG
jgi:hypothetical protein